MTVLTEGFAFQGKFVVIITHGDYDEDVSASMKIKRPMEGVVYYLIRALKYRVAPLLDPELSLWAKENSL